MLKLLLVIALLKATAWCSSNVKVSVNVNTPQNQPTNTTNQLKYADCTTNFECERVAPGTVCQHFPWSLDVPVTKPYASSGKCKKKGELAGAHLREDNCCGLDCQSDSDCCEAAPKCHERDDGPAGTNPKFCVRNSCENRKCNSDADCNCEEGLKCKTKTRPWHRIKVCTRENPPGWQAYCGPDTHGGDYPDCGEEFKCQCTDPEQDDDTCDFKACFRREQFCQWNQKFAKLANQGGFVGV